MKNKLIVVKEHINRNRGRYGIAAGFTACFMLNQHAVSEWNKFLDEKGLTEEYYLPED